MLLLLYKADLYQVIPKIDYVPEHMVIRNILVYIQHTSWFI
jgi:hypothetical protein